MTSPLATLDRVSMRFGNAGPKAISEISAEILDGRVTGLVGADGAGKTTLLRLIAGLLAPSEGALTVCGFNTVRDATKIKREVAYMPQRFGLYEDLAVIENLTLYADLRGVPGDERPETFDRLLQFTDLKRFTGRLAGALSGGMKQKLGLACALIRKPRLLLLDEPSVGVDPISRRELWKMVYELVDQGIGVIWSTAYLDEAERCRAVLALSEGKLLFDGAPSLLTSSAEGRTVLVQGIERDKRIVLTRALDRPEFVDGVIQGASVRLLLAENAAIPPVETLQAGPKARIEATAPRFEDAFMARLGARSRGRSALADARNKATSSDELMVEADQLTKTFGDFVAADRISFSIRRGEVYGLIGPNGAGKSTTFKMLCGLLQPSSGAARVAGVDLAASPGRARSRLGYMAQKFSLYGDLSVAQNLKFFGGVYGLDRRALADVSARMAETLNLTAYLDHTAARLPLGYKQRLALACSLLHDPDVLFLDEPTSGVDPRARREFWTHINALASRGVTILVTTHFLEEAEYCDRVALIYRGRAIAGGTPDELKAKGGIAGAPALSLEDAFINLVHEFDQERAA